MPPKAVAIVSDAHLGHAPESTGIAFRDFLSTMPDRADHLVINGDLFDFWFEYRRVIPRDAFRTLSALAQMREKGVRLTVTGGNHDRWGGEFWEKELGAAFQPRSHVLELLGRKAFLAHGDGLAETRPLSRLMHRVTSHPVVAGLFRLLHPDLGFWIADRLSGVLAEQTRTPEAIAGAATRQEAFARDLLAGRKDLDLVILGHTHHAVACEVAPGRWYVNPGAWMPGFRYALLTESGPALKTYEPRG